MCRMCLLDVVIRNWPTHLIAEQDEKEEEKRPWRSRSLLFKFADIAAMTTVRPEHTLPLKYVQEKVKEIREKGVLNVGGEDDPLVAYRRLIMTMRKWQETRRAWQYLPRMNTLLFHKPKLRTEEEISIWNSSAPLPEHEQERIGGLERWLNKQAEWNKYHTQSSMIYVSTDSVIDYGSWTMDPRYLSEMYKERQYDEIANKSDIKLYRISREDEYSSDTSETQYVSIDSYGFMDLLYYNLTVDEKHDLGFQLLRAALNYSAVDAPQRINDLNRQHFELLVTELNKHVPHKRKEDSLELAFQMLKRKLITRKTTKRRKPTKAAKEIPSVELDEKDINEFLQENFAKLQNKDTGTINDDRNKQGKVPVLTGLVMPEAQSKLKASREGNLYFRGVMESTPRSLSDQSNEIERSASRNIPALQPTNRFKRLETWGHILQGFPYQRMRPQRVRRSRGQNLFEDNRVPSDRRIRPYTTRKFTLRLNQTHGFARTLGIFRTYLATYFSRKRPRSFRMSKNPFSKIKIIRNSKPTSFGFRNGRKSFQHINRYNTPNPKMLRTCGLKNHKSPYLSHHAPSTFTSFTKTTHFNYLQRPNHRSSSIEKNNVTRTLATKNTLNKYHGLHINTKKPFDQATSSHQNTSISKVPTEKSVIFKFRTRINYLVQNSTFKISPRLPRLPSSKSKRRKKRRKREERLEDLKSILL